MAGFFDSLFGSSEETTKNTSQQQSTAPWWAQQPYLQQAFSGASNALSNVQGLPQPQQFVAGLTPQQQALYQTMYGYGANNTTPQQTARTAGDLSGAGVAGYGSGLAGLGG